MESAAKKSTEILQVGDKAYRYYPLVNKEGFEDLPYALRILAENVLRNGATPASAEKSYVRIVEAARKRCAGEEIEFYPARVLFQDFTGVPVFVDFAVMRDACADFGGNPKLINPQIPCDMVIDHSVIADYAGVAGAAEKNQDIEFGRNEKRYQFLKWAQESFSNVRIVPPGRGICHQLNIENFAQTVFVKEAACGDASKGVAGVLQDAAEEVRSPAEALQNDAEAKRYGALPLVYFDSVVGTDSHTPTVNALSVLAWGVGGIEAEACALSQPISILVPSVIGIRLSGKLSEGVCAFDVALYFAHILRSRGVVGSFLECFGPGLKNLSVTQRAAIANMTPEYGATATLFPVDEQTLGYLRLTGRDEDHISLVEAYSKAQGLWSDDNEVSRNYAEVIEVDLGNIVRSVAGPTRPHDRISLVDMHARFKEICRLRGLGMDEKRQVSVDGQSFELTHGAIAIAAVTSCTTATDPSMMVRAGLLAKAAVKKGLHSMPWVKTIFAPGSYASRMILERAGLIEPLEALGFYTCGFGCMSCIGNSGPIKASLHEIASDIELSAVLSGNRNFEGRISPDVSQNYLACPALVVAYALVGTMDIDLIEEPLGQDASGNPVYLADIWPEDAQVQGVVESCALPEVYREGTHDIFAGTAAWQNLSGNSGTRFKWDALSTYVRRAPYFDRLHAEPDPVLPIENARVLVYAGDFITTDHISPAGEIAKESAAARYLEESGVEAKDFNTYGARRGNHEVMMRGTFSNVRLHNKLAPGKLGGWTRNFKTGAIEPLFEVAQIAKKEDIPLLVIAGKMYGSGSSRDWAAKGLSLLGVRAVLAESYERIHRSNLVGMGILPLEFCFGQNAQSLGIDGTESFSVAIPDFSQGLPKPGKIRVEARAGDGSIKCFEARVRIDTPTEGLYFTNGGILPYVLRKLLKA